MNPSNKSHSSIGGGFYAVVSNLALAAVYFCAAKFGLSLAFLNASVSAVWPPSGIALAILLVSGFRLWPGVFLGAFLANLQTQGTLATSLGVATGNTLEALLGAWLVRRFANGLKAFDQPRDIFRFALLAAVFSTTASATLGVTSLRLGGFIPREQYGAIWFTWWLGDMVGALTVTPLLIAWMTQPMRQILPRRLLEAAGLLLVVALVR